jgi:Leucine-rich repeat (LRR) protein
MLLSRHTSLTTYFSHDVLALSGKIPWGRLKELVQDGPLRALHLGDNKFDVVDALGERTIPAIVWTMTGLKELQLGSLGYHGSIGDISGLRSLQKLYLNDNELEGPMPNFTELKQLVFLDIGDNELSGSITSSLGQCTKLEQAWLGNNKFDGPIPATLGCCRKLTRLSLAGNGELSGHLPDSLGQCTALVNLYLHKNSFEGPIPKTFSALTNLTDLRLGHTPKNKEKADNWKLEPPQNADLSSKEGEMEWKKDNAGILAFLAKL